MEPRPLASAESLCSGPSRMSALAQWPGGACYPSAALRAPVSYAEPRGALPAAAAKEKRPASGRALGGYLLRVLDGGLCGGKRIESDI